MQVKNRAMGIAIGGALAFGVVLAASAASAQEYQYPLGRAADDGGMSGMSSGAPAATPRQRRNSRMQQTDRTAPSVAPQSSAPHYGRNANDGGPMD
jgi:hypothetical protein